MRIGDLTVVFIDDPDEGILDWFHHVVVVDIPADVVVKVSNEELKVSFGHEWSVSPSQGCSLPNRCLPSRPTNARCLSGHWNTRDQEFDRQRHRSTIGAGLVCKPDPRPRLKT